MKTYDWLNRLCDDHWLHGLTATEVKVLVVLLRKASNADAKAYPSARTLARLTGCPRSRVLCALAVLQELGLVKIVGTHTFPGGVVTKKRRLCMPTDQVEGRPQVEGRRQIVRSVRRKLSAERRKARLGGKAQSTSPIYPIETLSNPQKKHTQRVFPRWRGKVDGPSNKQSPTDLAINQVLALYGKVPPEVSEFVYDQNT